MPTCRYQVGSEQYVRAFEGSAGVVRLGSDAAACAYALHCCRHGSNVPMFIVAVIAVHDLYVGACVSGFDLSWW